MLYNINSAGGGGAAGSKLVVAGVAGDIVTVSNDALGNSHHTGICGSDGNAVFRGMETGTWEISMTNGSQVSIPREISIVSDYSISVKYFKAYIVTTWPEGSTCTCSNGEITLTAPDTSGSYTFNVAEEGDWTVSCTNGTETATNTVSITEDEQSCNVGLSYEFWIINGSYHPYSPWVFNIYVNRNDPSYTTGSYSYSGSGLYIGGTWNRFLVITSIDVTKYKTLGVTIYNGSGDTHSDSAGVALQKPSSTEMFDFAGEIQTHYYTYNTQVTKTLDISNINGTYYLGCGLYAKKSFTIQKLWLR